MNKPYDPVALREELHAMPELALKETKTSAYVVEKLKALGIDVQANVGGTTGVVGTIRGEEPGPVVLIRADMDALPFVIDGKPCAIHACGHDAHTAMVLATASEMVGKVKKGTLKILFQPAEETLEGAPAMLKAGVLDDVDIAFGAHIRPVQDLPAGTVCPAVNHVASCTAHVVVHGKSCHAARPHLGVNALDVGTAIVQGVQSIWVNPAEIFTPKATQFHADQGATNSIPGEARITFDIRASTNPIMKELLEKIRTMVEMTAKAHGATAEIDFGLICPAAEYDEALVEEVADVIRTELGEDKIAKNCGGGGEDFHFYHMERPHIRAAYFGVGVGATPGLHAATMNFDPKYLPMGVKVFVELLRRHLG